MSSSPAIELEIGHRRIRITNPDRVYFPARGETKLDLAHYYLSVGEGIVRALRERPCMLHRFPSGVTGAKVHQKRLPAGAPPWVQTVRVAFPSGRSADELCVTDVADVIWAVQMSTVEFHPWNTRRADVELPDEWRIDLDPQPGTGFTQARQVAMVVQEVLAEVGAVGWPKTSDGRGMHVYVRIEPRWGFADVRRAARAFAREVERRLPDRLTALTSQDVNNRAEAFRIALEVLDHAEFGAEDRWAASRFITRTLGWLWDVIAEPVLDTLGLGPGTTGSVLPRLWWMPTGMLSFLPLHAAGHHTRRNGVTVMDRVVSSYTPTVRALRQARATLSPARPAAKPLVVAMSTTDGHPDLPGALREAELLEDLLPQVRVLADGQASRAQVRESILSSDFVHFACHAASDVDQPSSSHLLLADGPLAVRDIGALRTPEAYLAFLSACSTSRGSEELPEEAIHVSSAFQLAGFPHVIATLWPIADDAAVTIAEHIYRTLIETSGSCPARAVHAATRGLRDAHDGNSPVLWASHIHSGA